LDLLGSGNFGSVYKARTTFRASEGAKITCVVKKVKVDLEHDINDASEALQEVKSLIKLDSHPFIVAYMDVWLHRDNPANAFIPPTTELCLMMEFCPNGDLFDRLEKLRESEGDEAEKLTVNKIMTWFAQLTDAVQFFHSKGITHCDLKLENIFLTEDDNVKVGDFGLSLQRPDVDMWGSTNMSSRGTPDYMAPECWHDNSKYTSKVDVWSVGVIL
ncbi:hypothetical protein GUITHDRAFT_39801, partial [Guillardia theta CCMP2712]